MTPDPLDELVDRCTFPQRDVLHCAISGGADSLALLVLAARCASRSARAVVAHHVDHQLQSGERPRAIVTTAAERFGVELVMHTVEVPEGSNLEMRARAARFAVLPDDVLTGHTADDQAETVMLQLLRGAGPEGLAAMSADRHPLLALRRNETAGLCQRLHLEVFEDPSNESGRFMRNRVRHELMPLLDQIAGRDVVPLLTRAADLQRSVVALLDGIAEAVDPTDAAMLRTLDPLVAATALRRWWRSETASPYAPDRAAIHRMMDVVHNRAAATDVADGWRLERTHGVLRLVPPPTPPIGGLPHGGN